MQAHIPGKPQTSTVLSTQDVAPGFFRYEMNGIQPIINIAIF
jgi:hypothetical protein